MSRTYIISPGRLQDDFNGELNRYFEWLEKLNKANNKQVKSIDCRYNKEKKAFETVVTWKEPT